MNQLDETIAGLKFSADGLIPAVCVDCETKQVLMVAYMNAESLKDTVKTQKTHFWSRSRQKYWMKGESSGHTQEVKAIYTDCDKDTLIVEVKQNGAACHEGYFSCFYRKLNDDGGWDIVAEKLFNPDDVYKK
ncbi:MAG: phosphoribosyl-AMP cyclohydrolase [Phycisphaerae bacterium]|nr:phosphoribosyl-AMP cyclohydrolase [Phycisphaerae bacterium]